MRVMAFDYGLRHIGVAVGSLQFQTAEEQPALSTRFGKLPEQAVRQLLAKWQPDLLVVGLPLNLDGSEQDMTGKARSFGRKLQTLSGLEVVFVDERLSSRDAKAAIFAEGGFQALARDKGHVDSVSACILLEQYFAEQMNHGQTV